MSFADLHLNLHLIDNIFRQTNHLHKHLMFDYLHLTKILHLPQFLATAVIYHGTCSFFRQLSYVRLPGPPLAWLCIFILPGKRLIWLPISRLHFPSWFHSNSGYISWVGGCKCPGFVNSCFTSFKDDWKPYCKCMTY